MRPSVLLLPLLAVVATAACTPRAVTPPSRTFALSSATPPAPGQSDASLGVSHIGTIWGPELAGGDARVRHAVRPGVVVEADAGLLHLLNNGRGGSRTALAGRLGVLLTPPADEAADVKVALQLGAGGGHSRTAGAWGTFDLGAVLSGTHRWIRPLVGVGGGMSRPVGDRTFTVTMPDGESTTLRLPDNLSAHVTAGVELGRAERALLLGATMTHFWLEESSIVGRTDEIDDDLFFAVGAAFRFTL
ncbi:MAG: hypothetical protein KJZ91_27945 [Myxococcales bacterium]|nr:hypothetical protein [Myxococcales bacterium]